MRMLGVLVALPGVVVVLNLQEQGFWDSRCQLQDQMNLEGCLGGSGKYLSLAVAFPGGVCQGNHASSREASHVPIPHERGAVGFKHLSRLKAAWPWFYHLESGQGLPDKSIAWRVSKRCSGCRYGGSLVTHGSQAHGSFPRGCSGGLCKQVVSLDPQAALAVCQRVTSWAPWASGSKLMSWQGCPSVDSLSLCELKIQRCLRKTCLALCPVVFGHQTLNSRHIMPKVFA